MTRCASRRSSRRRVDRQARFTPASRRPNCRRKPDGCEPSPRHGRRFAATAARVAGPRGASALKGRGRAGRSRCTGGRASTRTAPSPSTTTGACSSARGPSSLKRARDDARASRRPLDSQLLLDFVAVRDAARRAGPRPRRRRRRGRRPTGAAATPLPPPLARWPGRAEAADAPPPPPDAVAGETKDRRDQRDASA